MTTLALQHMARRLTLPFGRGSAALRLQLLPVNAIQADIAAYDFVEHAALYNRKPDPRYVLQVRQDIAASTQVTVNYEVLQSGGNPPLPGNATMQIPENTLAGSSFSLSLGTSEGPQTRLRRIHLSPAVSSGTVADWWQVTALLGHLARLLWVIGWEYDHLRRHLELVKRQRRLTYASGRSLDLIGSDLSVPRFPPLPYSYDNDTIALYHLEDQAGAVVEDISGRYGATAHDGANTGGLALAGAKGRFNRAFAFRDLNAVITIPDHPDFALSPAASFTVECLVNPENLVGDGHIVAKHADPANPNLPGWALSAGDFGRGLPANPRFLLCDGTNQGILFADQTLPAGVFTHLAGVIDRQAQEARLYVDGSLRRTAPISTLGVLTNPEPFRLGQAGGVRFQGIIDEVRLSRIARSHFHPLLGEIDESYQHRLGLFKRWALATPANLLNLLNDAVGEIGGDPVPLRLTDSDATMVNATHAMTIYPQSLAQSQCIDAHGNRRSREDEVSGAVATEIGFDPLYLMTHNDPRARYAPPPQRVLAAGEQPPDSHKMQSITSRTLNKLLDLLAAQVVAGQLRVESAFDPRAADLRAVGRGLLLTHPNRTNGQLAALSHRAGFAFVCRRDTENGVYASTPTGDYLDVRSTGGTATPELGFDLRVGQTLSLAVSPSLPVDTVYRWTTIACGAGRTRFTTRTDLPTVTLEAIAPGHLVVKVEATRRHRTISSTRTFRVSPSDLANGQSVGADGSLNVPETIASQPDPFFHPAYLLTHDDLRANYGANLNNRRLQRSIAVLLNRFLDLIAAAGGAGALRVVQAFVPGAPGPQGAGRALTLRPSAALTLSLGRLALLAHAAGFTYVRRQDPDLLVRHQPEDMASIIGPAMVPEGGTVNLTANPQASPRALTISANRIYVANGGTDTVSEIDPATGRVLQAIKTGWLPGALALNPAGTRLFVADTLSNSITMIETATGNVLATIDVSSQPVALVHHPTQPTLYVACHNADALVAIDTTTLAASSLAVSGVPTSLAVTPNGAEVWVATSLGPRIHIVASASFSLAATLALPEVPLDITIAPDGLRAYITFPTNARIRIFDIAGRNSLGDLNLGNRPQRLTMAQNGSTLYVTDPGPPELLYMMTPLAGAPFLTLRESVRVRQNPAGVAAGPSQVYVANQGSDEVSVINPQPGQVGVSDTWRLGSGLGESLSWVVRLNPATLASLSSTTDSAVTLKADNAGPLVVRAVLMHHDNSGLYTFEVRLKPVLEAAGAIIRKDQYDLIMNILNTFHPIGVEVSTRVIREHVIEVREGLLNAFPDYTYPNYRVRSPVARRERKE